MHARAFLGLCVAGSLLLLVPWLGLAQAIWAGAAAGSARVRVRADRMCSWAITTTQC